MSGHRSIHICHSFRVSYGFILVALVLQFKRLANIYFLVVAILQTIPVISPLDPVTAWAPLIFVLAISMIREGRCFLS